MSLQERTLVIKNFDPEKTTAKILKELCLQGGPVRNVVVRPDHAFVEFDDVESVGYSKALFYGIELFGKKLTFDPKIRNGPESEKYTRLLRDYIKYDRQMEQLAQQQQFLQYQAQNPSSQNTNDMTQNSTTHNYFRPPNQTPSSSGFKSRSDMNRSRSFNNRQNPRHNNSNQNRGQSNRRWSESRPRRGN